MPPTALFTVIAPSARVHVAGDLSFISTHSLRLAPLNSTTASEGGAPLTPGLTTGGTGVHTSVSSGRGCAAGAAAEGDAGCCCAPTVSGTAPSAASAKNDRQVRIERGREDEWSVARRTQIARARQGMSRTRTRLGPLRTACPPALAPRRARPRRLGHHHHEDRPCATC